MIVIPAIDMKDHKVVRLTQGLMSSNTIYNGEPIEMAKRWIDLGAIRLHLVDLNGAFEGKTVHHKEVSKIVKKYPDIVIEVGGGIRNMQTLKEYIDCGVSYCILGSAAIKNPDFLLQASLAYPDQIILGVDAKNGMVATEGWGDVSALHAEELIKKFENLALAEIIYTDIAKDGMMQGMSFETIESIADQSPIPIIASGGLSSLEDIHRLKKITNVSAVIAGKCLYENQIDFQEAQRIAFD